MNLIIFLKYLQNRGLDKVLTNLTQPFLGVCLGLQLMCRHTEENNTKCLGIFDLEVKKFPPKEKVPHMGWNKIDIEEDPLLENLHGNTFLYFVHSYYAEMGPETVATSDYILTFSAALRKGNYFAIQAHPEKSGEEGQQILKNFLDL